VLSIGAVHIQKKCLNNSSNEKKNCNEIKRDVNFDMEEENQVFFGGLVAFLVYQQNHILFQMNRFKSDW
jgi:hypothetical protein